MFSSFEIFGRTVPTYSVCAVAGGVFMCLYFILQCRKPRKGFVKIEYQDMLFMLVFAGTAAFIGAKLMFLFTSTNFVWYDDRNFWQNAEIWLFQIVTGGMVFYGGLIGAIFGALFYMKKYKTPYAEMFDLGFSGIPLFHAFGRVGCFLGGCCYGMEYHGPISVVYPENNLGGAPAGVELLPIQLIESLANLVLWAVLAAVYRKSKRRWFTSGLYLVSYGIIRFVLEFFRGDLIRGHIAALSSSQFISIFIVALGVFLIIRPKWLDKFGCKNDERYLEWVSGHKRRVEEYKAYKAAKKASK